MVGEIEQASHTEIRTLPIAEQLNGKSVEWMEHVTGAPAA